MFCYFVGGALGSVTAGVVLASAGWDWVCLLGAGFGALSLVMVVVDRIWPVPVGHDRRLTAAEPVAGAPAEH
jgi:MFS family permease